MSEQIGEGVKQAGQAFQVGFDAFIRVAFELTLSSRVTGPSARSSMPMEPSVPRLKPLVDLSQATVLSVKSEHRIACVEIE